MLNRFGGIDIQLFAEGNDNATTEDSSKTPENVEEKNLDYQTSENPTEVEEEEVIHDDDPVEILRKTAEELGLNTDDLVFMSRADFQSELDRRITQAIKTREEKLKREAERKRLEEEGKYQELMRMERMEALQDYKATLVKANGIPESMAELIDVETLANQPFAEAKKVLDEKVQMLKQTFEEYIQKQLEMQQKEAQKGTRTVGGVSARADTLETKLSKFIRR